MITTKKEPRSSAQTPDNSYTEKLRRAKEYLKQRKLPNCAQGVIPGCTNREDVLRPNKNIGLYNSTTRAVFTANTMNK
jgi:hypothetical protein